MKVHVTDVKGSRDTEENVGNMVVLGLRSHVYGGLHNLLSTLNAIRYQDEMLGPSVRLYTQAVCPKFLLVHDNVVRACRQFPVKEGIDTTD